MDMAPKRLRNLHKLTYFAPAMRKVLLHTCCAPCSSAIVEWMLANGWQPVIYYCNPNIWPQEEYLIRKEECTRYASALGLQIVDDDYDHESWLECTRGLEDEPERGGRCLQCFRYRLLRTAEYALDHGFNIMTSTLMSSRWKSLEQINEAGRWAVGKVLQERGLPEESLVWWDRNWRKGGLQERRLAIIREYGFYNQLYCGCEFSARKNGNSSKE